ncbi:MAG: PAS domain-containing protein [Crocinitomix sp.]|nr:PAS domain-containing protein [Crocinitomix sp.]
MKIKASLLLSLLLLFSILGKTESAIDGLNDKLATSQEDTLKILTLLDLSNELIISDREQSLKHIQAAIELSSELENFKYLGYSHKTLGIHYFANTQYKLAIENLLLAEAYFKKVNHKRELCNVLNWMGQVYMQSGLEYEALSKFEDVIPLFNELGDTVNIKSAYLNIGAVYHELEYYDLAEKYYLMSMVGGYKEGAIDGDNAFAHNNLGEVALARKQYFKAKNYFIKSIQLLKEAGAVEYLSLDYANLGLTYVYLEKYDSAKIYFDQSLSIANEFNDNYALLNTEYCIAVSHNAQEQYVNAIEVAIKGLHTSDSLGILMIQKKFMQSLAIANAGEGNYDLAYEYTLSAQRIQDSMTLGRDDYGLAHFESKFNAEGRIAELEKGRESIIKVDKGFWESEWFVLIMFFVLLSLLIIGLEVRRKNGGKIDRKVENIDSLQSTRILYLLAAILYTALFNVVPITTENLIDPIEARYGVSILILFIYFLTFVSTWIRRNLTKITLVFFLLMVAHHLYLTYVNDIALEEFLFLITIMSATPVVIKDFWPMFIFIGAVVTVTMLIGFTTVDPHVDSFLFIGIIVSICLVALVVTLTKGDFDKHLEFSNEAVSQAEAIVFIVNRRGENIYTSQSIKNILGFAPEDLGDYDWVERLGVSPADANRIKNNLILLAIGTIEPSPNKYQALTTKTGETKWFSFKEKRMDGDRVLVMGLDVTEQKRIEDELIQSEGNFRQINESLSDVFYLYNIVENKYEYISPNCINVLGAPAEFFYAGGKHADKYVVKEDLPKVKAVVHLVESGESYNITFRIRTEKGIRWIREKSNPVKDEKGNVIKNTGLCQDITEQRLAEQEIEKLSLIASNTDNFILMVSKENRVEWANPSFYRITGFRESEVIGQLPLGLISGGMTDEATIDAITEAVFIAKKQMQCELITYTKSLDIFHSSVEVTPLLDGTGELEKYFVIGSDITQRVSDREQIEKLSLVASTTSNYVIIAHALTGVEWVNEAFTEKFGYTLEEVVGRLPSTFLHKVDAHPELMAEINRTVIEENKNFKGEIVQLTKAGDEIHAHVDIMPFVFDGNSVEKYFVLGTDISERIRHQKEMEIANAELSKKEAELNESESNFRELIKSIKEVFWLADAVTNEMIFVSDSYQEVFGLTVQSLKDDVESWRETIHPQDKARVIAGVTDGYANGTFDDEFRIILKNGEEKWVISKIFAIKNEKGEIIKLSGFVEDITIKKTQAIKISKIADQLDVVHAIENTILTSESTADIIYNTLEKTIDKLPVLRASLTLFRPEEGTFYSYALMANEKSSVTDGKEYRLEDFGLYETLKKSKTNYIEDLTTKDEKSKTDQILVEEGAKLALLSPLLHGDKLIGSLNVCFTDTIQEDVDHYTEITNEVAKGLAIAIQQSQLKDELHLSNLALTSSIDYAKMIQQAYIPDDVSIDGFFKDNFVINRPKDIVSGDFYWVGKSGDTRIIAVGDCTGHGVPGAFMTIIGISALNNIIELRGIIDPAEILNELNKTIISALASTSDVQLRDGMDMGIFCYNDVTKKATYAGARRPLYHLNQEGLQSINGAKLSIGDNGDTFGVSFETYQLNVTDGDIFYLFSDGVTDQFGGERVRKFTMKRLANLMNDGSDSTMEQNREIIDNELLAWQGNNEQTDDILFVGFKFGK